MAHKRGRPREKSGERAGFALAFFQARSKRGLTQAQAAEELGVALSTVARWETGAMEPRGTARKYVGLWMRGEI